MKLTGEEIIEKIIEKAKTFEDDEDFEDDEQYDFEYVSSLIEGIGDFKLVDKQSTTSGDAWRVLYFKDHDVYIEQVGYFDSYESISVYDQHDYRIVEPKEETIIVYKPIEKK